MTMLVHHAPVLPANEAPHTRGDLDIHNVRGDFPILERRINGRRLIYLDNAATSQKPNAVIQAVSQYYEQKNANIHRGVHALSVIATEAHENAR
ncbi:MAG: aminotransferase class V-fold PLP-dependent enzyme, partial [Terracidiphilus sp.]